MEDLVREEMSKNRESPGFRWGECQFADKNIVDGDEVMEYESTEFEDGTKVEAQANTAVFGHDKNGIPTFRAMGKQTYPDEYVEGIQKM